MFKRFIDASFVWQHFLISKSSSFWVLDDCMNEPSQKMIFVSELAFFDSTLDDVCTSGEFH